MPSLTITPKEIHYIDVELLYCQATHILKMNNMILPRYIYKVYLQKIDIMILKQMLVCDQLKLQKYMEKQKLSQKCNKSRLPIWIVRNKSYRHMLYSRIQCLKKNLIMIKSESNIYILLLYWLHFFLLQDVLLL